MNIFNSTIHAVTRCGCRAIHQTLTVSLHFCCHKSLERSELSKADRFKYGCTRSAGYVQECKALMVTTPQLIQVTRSLSVMRHIHLSCFSRKKGRIIQSGKKGLPGPCLKGCKPTAAPITVSAVSENPPYRNQNGQAEFLIACATAAWI